jgi:hypothetical protein
MVLSNLDTPRVALTGAATVGGYSRMDGMQEFLVNEYTREHGAPPTDLTLLKSPSACSRTISVIACAMRRKPRGTFESAGESGINELRQGSSLSYLRIAGSGADSYTHRASRQIGRRVANAIFTFLYGDLHAHMVPMPMQFFLLAFVLNEVLLARDDKRACLAGVGVGAITVGC